MEFEGPGCRFWYGSYERIYDMVITELHSNITQTCQITTSIRGNLAATRTSKESLHGVYDFFPLINKDLYVLVGVEIAGRLVVVVDMMCFGEDSESGV